MLPLLATRKAALKGGLFYGWRTNFFTLRRARYSPAALPARPQAVVSVGAELALC